VVSGSLSSPSRGAFHLSLTVLVHYRSLKVFSLGGWSPLLPTNSPGFVVLRMSAAGWQGVLYGTLTLCGGAFQRLPVHCHTRVCCSYNPRLSRKTAWFGLFPSRSPLLRESRLISLRRATEMFQFAHGPPPSLCLQLGVSRHHSGRVAPFGFSGLVARMQLPLNVSPVSASFIGLQRLGIHLVLSLACAPWFLLLPRALPRCSSPSHTLLQVHTHVFAFLCFSSLFLPWQY
jgi:hypothetical protein